jgi:methyl acetate hydrolase
MQVDSVIAVASFTKLITTIAALQLVDEGIIGLDAEASEYLPTLKKLKILREANEDKVNFGSPKRAPTIRELMTHTSGYVYPYWNRDFFLSRAKSIYRIALF